MTAIEDLLPQRLDWPPDRYADVLRQLPAKAGVWLLLAEGDVPVLAATSQSIRAVVAGRLAAPDPAQRTRRADLRGTCTACRYALTAGRFESDWLYGRLIGALWPGEFWHRVSFAPMWTLKAAPVGGIMKLQPATAWLGPSDAVALGPLATRADAQGLADLLTDLFDLCRYWSILAKAPHGQACAYHQMGRCPAPCDGSIGIEQYNDTVRQAVAFAAVDRRRVLERKKQQMLEAAEQLGFEQAGQIKTWLERAAALDAPPLRHLGDVRRFAGIAVSRSRTLAGPFFFWSGVLEAGEALKASTIASCLSDWRRRLEAGPATQADAAVREWQCGLVSTHLFRPQRSDWAWLPGDGPTDSWLRAVGSLQS